MQQKVSAVVITLNEVERLGDCLRSLAWCDEVVVLDSGSTDGTVELARAAGARVQVQAFAGYGQQKNDAAALARNDWVLNVDADERVTDGLRRAVQACDFRHAAYRVHRQGLFLGRPHRPMHKARADLPVRLYDRRRAAFTAAIVHESVLSDDVGEVDGVLLHDNFRSMSDQAARLDKYSSLLVEQTPETRASALRLAVRPVVHFLWSYLRQGAFRDGSRGFVLSAFWAYHDFLVEAKRLERDVRAQESAPGPTVPARRARRRVSPPGA